MLRRQFCAVGVLEDVEPFGEGLHHPVLYAIMDHLGEVASAVRPGMDIALLRPGIAAAAGRGGCGVAARDQGTEDRVQPLHHRRLAADHQAIATC